MEIKFKKGVMGMSLDIKDGMVNEDIDLVKIVGSSLPETLIKTYKRDLYIPPTGVYKAVFLPIPEESNIALVVEDVVGVTDKVVVELAVEEALVGGEEEETSLEVKEEFEIPLEVESVKEVGVVIDLPVVKGLKVEVDVEKEKVKKIKRSSVTDVSYINTEAGFLEYIKNQGGKVTKVEVKGKFSGDIILKTLKAGKVFRKGDNFYL